MPTAPCGELTNDRTNASSQRRFWQFFVLILSFIGLRKWIPVIAVDITTTLDVFRTQYNSVKSRVFRMDRNNLKTSDYMEKYVALAKGR